MGRNRIRSLALGAALIAAPALAQAEAQPPLPPEVWTCNAEMVCKSDLRQSLEVRDEQWLKGDRRDDRDVLIDGDTALLQERYAKKSRFYFPGDARKQDRFVADRLDDVEGSLRDSVLGIVRPSRRKTRAGGGLPVLIASAPFIAQIRYRDSLTSRDLVGLDDTRKYGVRWESRHRCGSTLIAHDWVVTAAHCVNPDEIRTGLAVQLGVTDISTSQGLQVNVDSAVIHAGYDPRNIYINDIALLHLAPDKRARDPRSVAIAMPDQRPLPPRQTVHAAGWGRINNDPRAQVNATALLRRVEMQTLDNPDCAGLAGYGPAKVKFAEGDSRIIPRVHSRVVCVYGNTVKTCNGDSGGPLYFGGNKAFLVGIVSWNKKGCEVTTDDSPGVYTRIQPYVPWINKAMRQKLKPGETRRLAE